MDKNRPNWTSRYAFILAAVGSAVGLGNIWRFPYIMGQNGGAVFLMVYLLLILTICFVPLVAELAVGKIIRKNCVSAYETINPKFKLISWMNPITGILIASFYFVVGGWIIRYILLGIENARVSDYGSYFLQFTKNGFSTTVLAIVFLFICILFTARGIKKGIEVANNILMPLFAVILICLICFSLSLPNAHLGLEYMFKPDFSKINGQMILCALGQALFTLSIGMGALLTYGSYLKKEESITKSAYTIILADTFFALLAGIMIFPAIFSFGLEPGSGAGLVFITLPYIFSQIPFGNIISVAFFVLLLSAAITSGISIVEAPVSVLIERFHITRTKACAILFCIISVIAVTAALSFGLLQNFTLFGKTFFDFLDFTTSVILMPLNTLFLCLIAGWSLKLRGEMFVPNKYLARLFNIALKFIIPAALLILMYFGLKQ